MRAAIFFVGLLFTSFGMGFELHSIPAGSTIFGVGLIVMALLSKP